MRIRLADASDMESLAALVCAFRDHLGASSPSDDQVAASLPRLLADSGIEFCLAFEDRGAAVGYTQTRFFPSVWAAGTEAYLEDLFVSASARGAGVGLELMQFSLRRAQGRGARLIGLTTNENNAPAHALYRKAGFRPATEKRWEGGRELRWERSLA